MFLKSSLILVAILVLDTLAIAQPAPQVQLKIEPSNRTLSVSAEERVTADSDLAILHIGFQTPPSDAKSAYAAGAKISNEVIAALKQAGVPEASIRSERQSLESVDAKAHRFRLEQSWSVKAQPARAAELLDMAVAAGATESGEIDWTLQDVRALEDEALEHAAARAKADATVLAKAMGARLGAVLYVSKQVSAPSFVSGPIAGRANFLENRDQRNAASQALVIEPRKVSRTAQVYAVFTIE